MDRPSPELRGDAAAAIRVRFRHHSRRTPLDAAPADAAVRAKGRSGRGQDGVSLPFRRRGHDLEEPPVRVWPVLPRSAPGSLHLDGRGGLLPQLRPEARWDAHVLGQHALFRLGGLRARGPVTPRDPRRTGPVPGWGRDLGRSYRRSPARHRDRLRRRPRRSGPHPGHDPQAAAAAPGRRPGTGGEGGPHLGDSFFRRRVALERGLVAGVERRRSQFSGGPRQLRRLLRSPRGHSVDQEQRGCRDPQHRLLP